MRDGNLRGQRRHGALVVVGEKAAPRVLQIEHADHFVFVDQRHSQFRAGFRIEQDIARVLAHVGHQNACLVSRRIAHQAAVPEGFRASDECFR